MIIPSDQVLVKSVEYYDPNRKVIYLERDFWQRYFSMLLRDFALEMGMAPTPLMKRRLASLVKDVLFEYWHTKYVRNETYTSSLWRELNRCFMSVSSAGKPKGFTNDIVTRCMITEDIRQESQRLEESSKPADGSEVVDELVNDYSQMEFDSLKEIEMEAIIESAARDFYSEKTSIARVKSDYEAGRFEKYIKSDVQFSDLADMVFEQSLLYKDTDKVCVGEVTLWNLVDMRSVMNSSKHTLQDFSIARFNNFYKQYCKILVFRRLVDRIGYDTCEMIYRQFMKNMSFNYVNVYEYAFCTVFLCDFCKRSIFARSKFLPKEPFISFVVKGNTHLFVNSYSNVPTPFNNGSVAERSSIIQTALDTISSGSSSNSSTNRRNRDSIFSQNGGGLFSNAGSSDFVFGQM